MYRLFSNTQNGFIDHVDGWYIGDFEKAFDSISWKKNYDILLCFNLGIEHINLIQLINTNIKASVGQCGTMSETFPIERGCRQADPIAAYLFILCNQILTLLIKQTTKINGIIINGIEYIMTQFAYFTILHLELQP